MQTIVSLYGGYYTIHRYAEEQELKLIKGLISPTENFDNYIDEHKFKTEILTKYGFVVTQFKTKEDKILYITVCADKVFENKDLIKKMMNIIKDGNEILLLVLYSENIAKLKSLLNDNKPVMNYITIQSFYANPLKHKYAPVSVEVVDYSELENFWYKDKKTLPEISFYDPIVAYLRFKPGEVIKIKDISPINGIFVSYRLII